MRCCFECRFFRPDGKDYPEDLTEADWDHGRLEGECRCQPPRRGPVLTDKFGDTFRFLGEWPRVLVDDWCGEFELRAQSQCDTGDEQKDSARYA